MSPWPQEKEDKVRETLARSTFQMETRGKVKSAFNTAMVEGRGGKPWKDGQGRPTQKGQRILSIDAFREAGRRLVVLGKTTL